MRRFIGVMLCLGVLGCGGLSTREAKGRLTWEDGSPIAAASVRFVPGDSSKPEAVGFTNSDGEFSLQTQNQPGALPGDYTVVVVKSAGATAVTGESPTDPKDLAKMMKAQADRSKTKPPVSEVPPVYGTVETTPLKNVKVDGSTPIELKLKKS
jgi:hypothetical protein